MSRTGSLVSRRDDGFTLVELIIAIVILGVITTPLASVVIGFLRNTDETSARMLESHDAQIASAYWAQDVASIGTRSATSPYSPTQSVWQGASGLFTCSAGGTAIATLAWDDFTVKPDKTVSQKIVQVVYETRSTQLQRVRCEKDSASGVISTGSTVFLAQKLDPATPPAVACSTACTAAPGVPQSVTLTLTLKSPDNRNAAYAVRLTGQRRQT